MSGIASGITIGWSLTGWLFGGADNSPRIWGKGRPTESTDPSREAMHEVMRDAALLSRIRTGDQTAMDALVYQYAQPLVNVALPIVGSIDLAQDVVQDVFFAVWEARTKMHVHTSLSAYLVRATRNRAIRITRRERAHQRTQHALESETAMDAYAPQTAAHADTESDTEPVGYAEFHAALHDALQHVQPRTREVFLLRADLGMSYAEIADALGIGVPTVRNLMYRAIKALAMRLRPWRDLLHWDT